MLLEENIVEYFHDLEVGRDLLNRNQKNTKHK